MDFVRNPQIWVRAVQKDTVTELKAHKRNWTGHCVKKEGNLIMQEGNSTGTHRAKSEGVV